MTGYKRGDVVLAIFPNSDRLTFKKRPVLVLQNESVQTYFGQTIVAPITSNQGRVSPAMLPVRVGSPEHSAMGLLTDSVINLETLTTLAEVRHESLDSRGFRASGQGKPPACNSRF